MLYCKSNGRRLLQHELARVACDSRDSRHMMRLRESCATESCVTLVKFDEILPLYYYTNLYYTILYQIIVKS